MITLNLEINEINGILSALGQMPYVQVRELVRSEEHTSELQSH